MFINHQGINFELNKENRTAKILPSKTIEDDIRIPRVLLYENTEYLITEISEESFRNSFIKTLIFDDDSVIKTIPKNAFSYSSIQNLHLSTNVEELKEGWCHQTPNLTHITISPENKRFRIHEDKLLIGITKENDEKLYFAIRDIDEIMIPSTIREIESNSFELCKQLRTVYFSNESRLVKICKKAFSRSSIESITIPKQVSEICDKAFYFCPNIHAIYFEEESELRKIGNEAFGHSSFSIDEGFLSDLPTEYETLKNQISNKVINDMYQKFSFKYYQNKEQTKLQNNNQNLFFNLFLYLKQFKFITYHMHCLSDIKKYSMANTNRLFGDFSSPTKTNCVFCVENRCIIIEQVEISFIENLIKELEKQGISLINVSLQSYISIGPHEEAREEIDNFCSKFQQVIKGNDFFKYTNRSIIGYLIRRFYYPTDFFHDSSFFNFDQSFITKEQEIKSKLNEYLFKKNELNSKVELNDIIEDIKTLKSNDENTKNHSVEFSSSDFIELKTIHQKKKKLK